MRWKTVESTNMIEIIMIGVTDLKMPKLNGQEEYLTIRQKILIQRQCIHPQDVLFLSLDGREHRQQP